MRILWLCNIILPPIAKELGIPIVTEEEFMREYLDK